MVNVESLEAYCREHAVGCQVSPYVDFVDVWPLTGSRKIGKLDHGKYAAERVLPPDTAGGAIDA